MRIYENHPHHRRLARIGPRDDGRIHPARPHRHRLRTFGKGNRAIAETISRAERFCRRGRGGRFASRGVGEAILQSHAAPDLLLNNAALINRNAPLWEIPAREFSDVIDVNIKGVANVIRHFVPAMIARAAASS
jgi:NAD(P)-dependent dehydrogenase (short-subunit alcohol dehydrogenase family)